MDIVGKKALVLGGFGLVGKAICRELIARQPEQLIVGSLRKVEAQTAVEELNQEFPETKTKIIPVWGDVFLRAEWQQDDVHPRPVVMADPIKRRRLMADILDELNDDIIASSLLTQFINGTAPGLDGTPVDIVIDSINTSTAVAYQNIYATASRLADLIDNHSEETNWPEEVQQLLTSLYIPQLVRHIQILHEAMVRSGTQGYIKIGTSGTGGMGLNIPYTHGEEKPSRVLLSKAALGGAQTLLTFLMARTPGKLKVVKEFKPTGLIAWKKIDYGPVRRGGQDFLLYDCDPNAPVSIEDPDNLVPQGEFGSPTGEVMNAVYVNTGENGLFAAGDFSLITALGQMQFITPEEIAENVVRELEGGNTGRDIIGAMDGAVMDPTFRAGFLRQAAIHRLQQLEAEHGESVAFEILGPPRMSKLLFEAHLLKRAYGSMTAAIQHTPEEAAETLHQDIIAQAEVRQQILSIGLPVLLPDGKHMLRGPLIKSKNAFQGWVDLTPANMAIWQDRLRSIQAMIHEGLAGDTSSAFDRVHPALRQWDPEDDSFHIGEIVAWVANYEDEGRRDKG